MQNASAAFLTSFSNVKLNIAALKKLSNTQFCFSEWCVSIQSPMLLNTKLLV